MRLCRWSQRIDAQKVWLVLTALIGIVLALLLISQINARLHPILLELALSHTANHITASIDKMVAEQAIEYSDLVTLERSQDGEIVALTSNMAQANILRAQLLDTALAALEGLQNADMEIPLGTICDWDLFSGLGPGINVRILYTGTASAEFENTFSTAGINQTCHQIVFRINADIAVLLPGNQYRSNVSTDVCVAETIIVGKVPETYLQIEP